MYTRLVDNDEIPRCIQVFEQSVNSPVTRKSYRERLDAFMEFSKISDYEILVKTEPKQLQTHLENYVMYLKRKHEKGDFRARSFMAYLAAIEAFFVQNDVNLNFKKIRKWIPKYEKLTGQEPYTNDDVKKMLAFANTRWKAIIHFFASTGARPDAVFELKRKHLKPIGDGSTIVTFYQNDSEEYCGFLTPEATAAMNAYFQKREFDGEKLTDESPIFRNAYRETQGWKIVKHIILGTAYSSFAQLLEKAGLRKIRKGVNKTRHSKRIFYGFRKRYNTILKDNMNVNPNTAEKLMGHKNGLDGVYYTPTIQKRFIEFSKAIPDLIIADSERQKIKIEKLEKKKTELERKEKEIENLKENMEKMVEQKIGEYNQKFMEKLEKMYDERNLASKKRLDAMDKEFERRLENDDWN